MRRSTGPTSIKITAAGPFTPLAQQAAERFYKDEEEMILAYAAAVNEEKPGTQGARRRET